MCADVNVCVHVCVCVCVCVCGGGGGGGGGVAGTCEVCVCACVCKHFPLCHNSLHVLLSYDFYGRIILGMFDPPNIQPYWNFTVDLVNSPSHQVRIGWVICSSW